MRVLICGAGVGRIGHILFMSCNANVEVVNSPLLREEPIDYKDFKLTNDRLLESYDIIDYDCWFVCFNKSYHGNQRKTHVDCEPITYTCGNRIRDHPQT